MLAPVPTGVVMFDGSSDVNIVADEGEMMYFDCIFARRASLKPANPVSFKES